jgi:hypothetical protein
MKQIILSPLTFCLLFCLCVQAQVAKKNNQKSVFNAKTLLQEQILLTNSAKFKGNRDLDGASGFLIDYKNSSFAVTAKHLLGEAGGVEPEIELTSLENNLIEWKMMPRSNVKPKETVNLNTLGLKYTNSIADILILNIASKDFTIKRLIPNFEIPKQKEKLYMVGCPYSEDNCRQNIYEVTFSEFVSAAGMLICELKTKVQLSGFSGSPLLNKKGEVIGVLVGGGEFEGKNFVTVTHIKEIEKFLK